MTRASKCAVVPGTDLCRDLALVHRLVRQHRLTDHVADGEDVRLAGALLVVDGDEAAIVHRDARLFGVDQLAVRTPADRDQHLVEGVGGRLALVVLEGDLQPALLRLDRR